MGGWVAGAASVEGCIVWTTLKCGVEGQGCRVGVMTPLPMVASPSETQQRETLSCQALVKVPQST